MKSKAALEKADAKGSVMLSITEDRDGLIHILASGKLSEEDFDQFEPEFEAISKTRSDPTPMVIELARDFSGWDAKAFWRDLKFDMKHVDEFGRIAILGTKDWEEWGTKASNLLFPAKMRFFETSQRDAAIAWALGTGS